MSEGNSEPSSFSLDKQKIEKILIAVVKAGYKEKIIAYGRSWSSRSRYHTFTIG
jgi:hypothetical protein